MILASCDVLPDYEVTEVLGLVRGSSVRTRHLGKDIMAWMKGVVGGEVREYTKLLAESREQALDRLTAEARVTPRAFNGRGIGIADACTERERIEAFRVDPDLFGTLLFGLTALFLVVLRARLRMLPFDPYTEIRR